MANKIPELPDRKYWRKFSVRKGSGPSYGNLAYGLNKATMKSSSALHSLKPYTSSILSGFNNRMVKWKLRKGGLSNRDQIRLYRKILSIQDKQHKTLQQQQKDPNLPKLKDSRFARNTLKNKLLKHFAKDPKLAARIEEQFSEDLKMGGTASRSITKHRGTGETLTKANRRIFSSAAQQVKNKSLSDNPTENVNNVNKNIKNHRIIGGTYLGRSANNNVRTKKAPTKIDLAA